MNTEHHRAKMLNYFASFALFVLLPAIIAVILGVNAIALEQQRAFNSARNELETRLTQFACDVDTDVFLTRVARGAWFKLKNAGSASEIGSFIKSLQDFLPVEFDLYFFDEKAELLTPRRIKLRSRYVATRLWELIKANSTQQSRLYKKIRKPVKSLLGGEFKAAQLLEKKDGLLPIIARHQSGRVYWQQAENGKGMIMVFWQLPRLEYRIKIQQKRENADFFKAFARVSDESVMEFGQQSLISDQAEKIFSRLALMNQPFVFAENEIWVGKKLKNGWVAVCKSFSENYYQRWHWFLIIAVFFLLLFAAIIALKVGTRLRITIRTKLISLFLIAVLMPIMGFMFLGYQYHFDREQTMVTEISNHSRQMLFSLDEYFRKVGQYHEPALKKLLPVFATENRERIRQLLRPKIETNELVTVEIRDAAAKISFTEVNELFFEGMKEVSEAFSRFAIDTALGSNLGDGVDPIVGMIVKAPEGGMFFLFDRPGEIHPLEFGPVPLLIFWQMIENLRAEKLYVFVVQSASVLLQKMVKARLAEIHRLRENQPYLTLACNNSSGEWFPAAPAPSRQFQKFAQRLRFSDKPLDAEMVLNGQKWLVTGQKGKYAGDYSFFSFYPRDIVDTDLRSIRLILYVCMLIFLLVAILTGSILSHTFLEPVQKLSQGVTAIKNRDGSFRIKTRQKDEFGDLSVSFNSMIEDLKEMQLARDVQESLLPGDFPPIPGYQINFINRMASDVGGDYFDLHRLDEKRVCLLIGDVTGHGVSSALVMAMAKAIVYQGLKEQRTLIELFGDLNLTIHTYFKIPPARKMITLFAAILDVESGELSCANAGHNFPVKVLPAGQIEEMSAVHLPIGATKKLRGLKLNRYYLEKGEMAVFYTDGLIEVTNSQGEMYGYDRFKSHLQKLASLSAAEAQKKLVESYDEFLGNAEPDDDLTIIVLKRTLENSDA